MQGLGARVRALRANRGLTMAAIAKKTGIDQATLSRIEHGKMTGTLQSHVKIADALGLRLPELYEHVGTAPVPQPARRLARAETFLHAKGAVAELLAGASHLLRSRLMPIRLRIKSQGRTATEEYPVSAERFVYVLRGSLEVRLGKERRTLHAGESWLFSASIPHHFRSRGSTDTLALSVMSPASL